MKDSTRLFVASAAIALPCAIAMSGDHPPIWAWVGGSLVVAIATAGGWLLTKEILAEDKASNPSGL